MEKCYLDREEVQEYVEDMFWGVGLIFLNNDYLLLILLIFTNYLVFT